MLAEQSVASLHKHLTQSVRSFLSTLHVYLRNPSSFVLGADVLMQLGCSASKTACLYELACMLLAAAPLS